MSGSILIFCMGISLVWEKVIKAANPLPAPVLGATFAFVL